MTTHVTAKRDKWLEARLDLLAAEKDLTRRSDEVAQLRQRLPWVRVEKTYTFDTETGSKTLKDLFDGRSQLLVYHFMFGPDYKAGCASCSAIADGFDGISIHLENHDVAFTAVSRAPVAKLKAFKERMGWRFAWASSIGGNFNYDFNVSFTEEQQRRGDIEYNYSRGTHAMDAASGSSMAANTTAPVMPEVVIQNATMAGADPVAYVRERPGMSAFVQEDGVVYHTYSTYARGLDGLWGMYQWLDRAPKGRNEEPGVWWRHHDRYGHD
jgi:predicted dithiol-disulfide oxidoreductase (DUF899 family)